MQTAKDTQAKQDAQSIAAEKDQLVEIYDQALPDIIHIGSI